MPNQRTRTYIRASTKTHPTGREQEICQETASKLNTEAVIHSLISICPVYILIRHTIAEEPLEQSDEVISRVSSPHSFLFPPKHTFNHVFIGTKGE